MKRLISLRIQKEIFEKLREQAERKNKTFSEIVREKLNKNSKIEVKGGKKQKWKA